MLSVTSQESYDIRCDAGHKRRCTNIRHDRGKACNKTLDMIVGNVMETTQEETNIEGNRGVRSILHQ